MSEQAPFTPDRVAALMEVLRTPEHQVGLHDTTFTVVEVTARAAALVRVTGAVSGTRPLDEWVGPNIAVRLSLPERPAEFDGVEGAPETTARVYTIAEVNPTARTLAIDIVRHPETSPVMNWLNSLRGGEVVPIAGPRPHRLPGPGSPRILLADSSALPAALGILARLPIDVPTTLVVAAPEDEVDLAVAELGSRAPDVTVNRIDPSGDRPLSTAFAGMSIPVTGSVWAAGERDDVREIRRRCRNDLDLAPAAVQVFGYWKRGVSNTRIDLARLETARASMDAGRPVFDVDDLDIGL